MTVHRIDGRRAFLQSAALSPFLLNDLRGQTQPAESRIACARDVLADTLTSLRKDQDFVTNPDSPFPPGYFGFSLGHPYGLQLLLSKQLGRLETMATKLVPPVHQELVSLFQESRVKLVPSMEQIRVPPYLMSRQIYARAGTREMSWTSGDQIQITGNTCADLLINLVVTALGLQPIEEVLGKVIWKVVGKSALDELERMVIARNWSRLAELGSTLLEKLASKEAVAVLELVGGAAARRELLEALSERFVPFLGYVIFAIQLVALLRENWGLIRAGCFEHKKAAS